MATIYEVSKLAGVSLATVSRVINDSERVLPETRAKVMNAIDELGYHPNHSVDWLQTELTQEPAAITRCGKTLCIHGTWYARDFFWRNSFVEKDMAYPFGYGHHAVVKTVF